MVRSLQRLFNELNDEINNKKVAIFFGAGISKGSGNLLVDDIVSLILFSMKHKDNNLFDEKTINTLKIEQSNLKIF